MTQQRYNWLSWGSVAISVALVTIVWGSGVNWKIGALNEYQWFPLLGLIAWVIMAKHYYLGVIRIKNPGLTKPRYFKSVTEYIVLACLLLHPGILAIAQYQNDQGVPPQAFVNYVGEGLRVAVFFGTLSLLIFLSYEVFTRLQQHKIVKKYWIGVSVAQSIAMTLIWIHGIRLGDSFGEGWFKVVWIAYGLALIPSFYIIHAFDLEQQRTQKLSS